MKRGLYAFMVFVMNLGLSAGLAQAAGYSMQITFTNVPGGATLTNFPALVKLTTTNTDDYISFLDTTDGYDLRFWTNSTLSGTELNYEIDTFDTNDTSFIWVQIPELTQDTAIWASWGDETYNSQQSYTTNGDVWSEGFVGVWHMTNSAAIDSTAGGHHGTKVGAVATTSAMIGSGQQVGGTDYIQVLNHSDFDVGSGDMTWSCWISKSSDIQTYSGIIAKDGYQTYALRQLLDTTVAFYNGGGSKLTFVGPGNDTWFQLSYTHKGGTGTFYADGASKASSAAVGSVSPNTKDLLFGYDPGKTYGFSGVYDEIRISNVSRSSNWIMAEYMNQGTNHNSFVEYGAPILTAVPGAIQWSSADTIKITQTSAWARVTVNTNLDTCVLVWDTTDHTPGTTNEWPVTNRVSLGGQVAGVVTGQVTGLSQGNTYTWRFYGHNASTNGWSSANTFSYADLGCSISADTTVATAPSNVVFTAVPTGDNTNLTYYAWDFGDGHSTNGPALAVVTNTYSSGGIYTVSLTVSNEVDESASVTNTDYIAVYGDYIYVSANSASPSPPYHTWANAADSIADAVSVAPPGATLVVSNGTYNITAQITIDKAVTIISYGNGVYGGLANATNTIVDRGGGGAYQNDKSRVFNCTAGGAVLDGLTITGAGYVYAGLSGGGVYMPNGGTVQNCIVKNNIILSSYTIGAGIYIADGTVSNCIVKGNRSLPRGGGTGIWADNTLIVDCDISNNQNGDTGSNQQGWLGGGGICAFDSEILNCRIVSNRCWAYNNGAQPAGAHGGGILAVGTTLIRNCLIEDNLHGWSGYHGGGVYGGTIESCTIVGNSASSVTSLGGGIYGSVVTNSIVLDNTTGSGDSSTQNYDGSSTFSYSCAEPKPTGSGNTDTATFVDAAAGNYQLMPGPAVDGGLDLPWMSGALDLAGTNRILGTSVDMGAYERVPSGLLECSFLADVTTVVAPSNVVFTAAATGPNTNITLYTWDFGDGQTASGATLAVVTNTYNAAGLYTVTVTVTNDAAESASATNVGYVAVWGGYAYVAAASPAPSVPYHTWSNAAHTIVDATAVAPAGTTVVLTNGTYSIPGQVVIDRELTLTSYGNGVYGGLANATNTVIDRGGGGAYQNDKSRVLNCSAAGTVLDGLTLMGAGYVYSGYNGGGVYMPNGGTVQNCIVKDNIAPNSYTLGAGIYIVDGTVSNCVVKENYTGSRGGGSGIWADNTMIADCRVLNNTNSAGYDGGGGIYATDCQVFRCKVLDNTSSANNSADCRGGGIYAGGSTLVRNCLIAGNLHSASGYHGGGVAGGTVESCTIVNNSASSVTSQGGGVYGSVVTNSIVLGNTTGSGDSSTQNYDGSSMFAYSCSEPKPSGSGNIDTATFVDAAGGNYQLEPGPAVDGGIDLPWMPSALDLAGTNRILSTSVDMGAYERVPSGVLECSFLADVTTVSAPSNVVFTAEATGPNTNITSYTWDFGDGQTASGTTLAVVTNTYNAAGLYTVTLTVTNDAAEGASVTNYDYVAVWGSHAFVAAASPSPSVPYHTWSNAAHTIPDAIAPAPAGTTVVLTNDTYAIPGEILISKALTITSYGSGVYGGLVNATNTVIDRGGGGAYQNDKSRVLNCSAAGTVLDGLTLMGAGYVYSGYSGGGVYMPNGGTVKNCIVKDNIAPNSYTLGAGIYIVDGTVSNCVVKENYTGSRGGGSGIWADNTMIVDCQVLNNTNSAGYDGGGGIYATDCQIVRCKVLGNKSSANNSADCHGAGIYAGGSTLVRNCLIADNLHSASGYHGGGAAGGTVESCTIVGNRASSVTSQGGGVYGSVVTNSIVLDNTTGSGNTTVWNYGGSSTFAYSCSVPKPSGVGNIDSATFVDAGAGDYQLLPCPAVNAGVNTPWMAGSLDLADAPRIASGVVDIGAFEYIPPAASIFYFR